MDHATQCSASGSRLLASTGLALVLSLGAAGCAGGIRGPVAQHDTVRFTIEAPESARVCLVVLDGAGLPRRFVLQPIPGGNAVHWARAVPLSPGEYRYFFLIDGDTRPDPASPRQEPDGFGGVNSVITVEGTALGGLNVY